MKTINGDLLAVPLCNTTDDTIISVENSKTPNENSKIQLISH